MTDTTSASLAEINDFILCNFSKGLVYAAIYRRLLIESGDAHEGRIDAMIDAEPDYVALIMSD